MDYTKNSVRVSTSVANMKLRSISWEIHVEKRKKKSHFLVCGFKNFLFLRTLYNYYSSVIFPSGVLDDMRAYFQVWNAPKDHIMSTGVWFWALITKAVSEAFGSYIMCPLPKNVCIMASTNIQFQKLKHHYFPFCTLQ